jgi:hypothetical protein
MHTDLGTRGRKFSRWPAEESIPGRRERERGKREGGKEGEREGRETPLAQFHDTYYKQLSDSLLTPQTAAHYTPNALYRSNNNLLYVHTACK